MNTEKDVYGNTMLLDAVCHGSLTAVEECLSEAKSSLDKKSYSAYINEKCDPGFTSLHLAARNGFTRIVEALLEGGADPGIKDNRNKTALDYASEFGHANSVKAIEKKRTQLADKTKSHAKKKPALRTLGGA